MQAQIKVQNQEKCLEWWLFFISSIQDMEKDAIFHLQRTQFKVLFLFPISYKDEGT